MATTKRKLKTEQDERQQSGSQAASSQTLRRGTMQAGSSGYLPQSSGEHYEATQQGLLQSVNAKKLARGLGWFSIGLGLAEVLAPRGVAKIAGVRGNNTLIRLFGLREIASGIGIFMQQSKGQRPAAAVWSRVAGDALDIAALATAFASPDSNKGRVAFATANVLSVTALDVLCAQQLSSRTDDQDDAATAGGQTQVKKSLIINRAPEELYQYWHNFENLPRFMKHLESVKVTGERRSHWVAKAPAGTSVEWDAEITEDRPNELIAWRSLEGADVDNAGSVRFEPATGGRGTVVRVEIEYHPPGGVIGAGLAKLFGEEPGAQAQEALRCFKQVMETGEVIISDGTAWDNGLLTQRPAQPLSSGERGELGQSQRGGAA